MPLFELWLLFNSRACVGDSSTYMGSMLRMLQSSVMRTCVHTRDLALLLGVK